MSKWIMTKKKLLLLVTGLSLSLVLSINNYNSSIKHTEMQTCLTVVSDLPMNSPNHPCFQRNASSNSWLAWVSGGSSSAYVHFIDLAELIQHSLH